MVKNIVSPTSIGCEALRGSKGAHACESPLTPALRAWLLDQERWLPNHTEKTESI